MVEGELIDRPELSEIFATEATLIHAEANTVTITFSTKRVHQKTNSAPLESVRVVTARIAMPLQAAVSLRHALSEMLEGGSSHSTGRVGQRAQSDHPIALTHKRRSGPGRGF